MEKTYMKYMSQGSGGEYKMKQAPNKTKEPKPFHGDGGGIDDGAVTEAAEEMEFLQMGIDAIDVIEDLLGEYETVDMDTLDGLGGTLDEKINYGNKGFNSGYLRTELPMHYERGGYDKLYEAYNNVKAYPQQATKGADKLSYPITDKPSVAKKKKDKAGWQGGDAGENDKVDFNHLGLSITDSLDLFASIFDLDEARVVTKDTIAKKKKELADASAAMRKQHAGSVGFNKRAEKTGFGGEHGKRQLDKVARAKGRKERGLKGRTGVYTANQGKVKSDKIIGGQRVKSDAKKKGLSGQDTDAFKGSKSKAGNVTKSAEKAARSKTRKKATAYYKGRKEANKKTELKNMGKEGVKKKASWKRKEDKRKDYEANKKFFGWKDDDDE